MLGIRAFTTALELILSLLGHLVTMILSVKQVYVLHIQRHVHSIKQNNHLSFLVVLLMVSSVFSLN